MRRLKIEHATIYTYDIAVQLQPHKLLLRPREGHDIRLESSRLEISPAYKIKWQRDVYGNSVAVVTFLEPAARLSIFSEVHIQHFEAAPLDFLVAEYALHFPFHYDPAEQVDLIPYRMSVFPADTQSLREWLVQFYKPDQVLETYVLLDNLNKAIAQTMGYAMREEPGVQSPAETLAKHSGSCRDLATLFIEACRFLGLAARFVSGYLYTPTLQAGPGATHAWSEVYLPGAGWKGFDSTSGEVVGNDHIAVAVSRHPEAVPPVSGTFIGYAGPSSSMEVDVRVTEIS